MKTLGLALFLPLLGLAQPIPDDSIDAGAALLHRSPVHTPIGGTSGGLVVIDATLDRHGEVTDARVVSGPEELRKSALSSVLTWHYAGDASAPASVHITIKF